MGVHVVIPVQLPPSPRVREERERRGLDPRTGKEPDLTGSAFAAVAIPLAVLAALGLFVWLVVDLLITLATH